MEQWKLKQELGKANAEVFSGYQWEWFCSLNLYRGANHSIAEDKLKKWRINMGIQDHILIAYMGAFNTIPHPHIHLIALSKKSALGLHLLDLDPNDWQRGWSDLTHCTAVIEPIYDPKGVAAYIAKKNLPWERSELIIPYNKRLLAKGKIQ